MKREKGGSSTTESDVTRWTPTPSPRRPLYFDRKDERSHTEKNNNNTILVHDTREWWKGIVNSSIKARTYQQV